MALRSAALDADGPASDVDAPASGVDAPSGDALPGD